MKFVTIFVFVAVVIAGAVGAAAQDGEAARRAAAVREDPAQRRSADETARIVESADREMRIEIARRMAPIDLRFGVP